MKKQVFNPFLPLDDLSDWSSKGINYSAKRMHLIIKLKTKTNKSFKSDFSEKENSICIR